jgi:hypothetical protein
MRSTTALWRPGGQRRGGRWTAAGHPGAGPAWRAACDPGAFSGTSASDVDSALTRRSLIVTWLNRGILHMVRTEDYWWLHPLSPQLRTRNSRRLAQEGVAPEDAERAVAVVRAALAADGPADRSQLRERVAAAGIRTEGHAMVHILALASVQGLIV